ncbi:hypothetical protein SDC9_178066 [bioreactor metagenome]|uniref:Uncharacterized protein n=1 Tax=bioreactor metagenome TaxID=1076179 RepID=A0A645GUY8_9ZZZZ
MDSVAAAAGGGAGAGGDGVVSAGTLLFRDRHGRRHRRSGGRPGHSCLCGQSRDDGIAPGGAADPGIADRLPDFGGGVLAAAFHRYSRLPPAGLFCRGGVGGEFAADAAGVAGFDAQAGCSGDSGRAVGAGAALAQVGVAAVDIADAAGLVGLARVAVQGRHGGV